MYDNNLLYTLPSLLSENPYPGRGILLGKTPAGQPLAAYFITGRSVNSRNRVFRTQGAELFIHIYDAANLADASLILYRPVRKTRDALIVTNGDQTDTIYDALANGGTFESALLTRKHEPDAPHFTPRISGLLPLSGDPVTLSILRSADRDGERCDRLTCTYSLKPGEGRYLHTYVGDGNPLPAFQGEPARVAIPDDPDAFGDSLWNSLNHDNRVALYLWQAGYEAFVFNRHAQGEDA